MDISSSSSGVTKGRKSSHTFNWVIKDFETRYISIPSEGVRKITGPAFQVTHPDGESLISWIPYLKLDEKNENVSAYLALGSCPAEYQQNGLLCTVQACVTHQSGLSPWTHSLKMSKRYKTNNSFGWPSFIAVRELKDKNLISHGMLRLRLELTMFGDELESSISSVTCDSTNESLILEPNMSFESLLQVEELSDVTVECGCESFPAHRAILAGRSDVFKTMLTSDMEEANSGLINITDLTPKTFQQILRYIYTGSTDSAIDSEDLLELTYGAEKYGLDELKRYCFTKLVACVTEQNVGSLAIAAHLYGAPDMVNNALKKFMEPKFFALMKQEEFRQMVEKNTEAFF